MLNKLNKDNFYRVNHIIPSFYPIIIKCNLEHPNYQLTRKRIFDSYYFLLYKNGKNIGTIDPYTFGVSVFHDKNDKFFYIKTKQEQQNMINYIKNI